MANRRERISFQPRRNNPVLVQRHRQPPSVMRASPEALRTRETREAVLEQIAHLGEEAGALQQHVGLIPEDVLTGRPLPGDPSFKEIYGLLALFDERVYLPVAARLAEADEARVETPDAGELLTGGGWNDLEMQAIIQRVRSARSRLVRALSDVPFDAWQRTVAIDGKRTDVFGLAYAIVRRDAELLRAAARRLHESRLTSREEDLPK